MRVTINQAGKKQIREFLAERHSLGHSLDESNIEAWAREAENHALEGNGVYIELPSRYAISGHTETLDISPDGYDTINPTAREIIDSTDFLADWFHDMLMGCGGQVYRRIYLDLWEMTLSESVTASCNEWLQRKDGSYREVASDDGWGADLSDDEKAWLNTDGVSDFGYAEWLDNELEPAIQKAMDEWAERQAERAEDAEE